MRELHFDAIPAGDGLLLRCSDDVLTALTALLDELLRLLEDGVVPPHRRPWWRRPAADELLRRMFDVSDEFWVRHREVLTDPGPVRRVRDRTDEPTPWLVAFDEVDDWIVAFARLRALHLTKTGTTPRTAIAFSVYAEQLALGLQPSAATGWPVL